jgi:hypothetical protein
MILGGFRSDLHRISQMLAKPTFGRSNDFVGWC